MKNKIQNLENSSEMDAEKCSVMYDFLSSMIADLLVVFDFDQKSFNYMPKNESISCSYTEKFLDFDCCKKIIHPNDRDFLEDVCNIIQDSLNNNELPIEQINYFSFLLRINSDLSSNGKFNYFMAYVKLKPQWVNTQLRYGICILSASVIREQNNQLFAYYRNMGYSNYSFKMGKWTYYPFLPLSKRQKEMLMWAQQGFSLKETADKMNVSDKTIESIRCALFEKFGVNSIEQAIQYASNRRLIYRI